MIKRSIILLLLCFILGSTSAQDIHFSQFSSGSLLINPGLTGYFDGDHRATLNYKNQWSSITTPYKTMAFQYDNRLDNLQWGTTQVGLGLAVYRDVAGDSEFGTTFGLLSGTFIKKLTPKHTVSVGFQGGYGQNSINSQNLTWDNQYNGERFDANLPSMEPEFSNEVSHLELSSGIVYGYKVNNRSAVTAGVALYHINNVKVNFNSTLREDLNKKLTGYLSGSFAKKNSNLTFNPELFYQRQGRQQELVGGMRLKYELQQSSKYTGFIQRVYVAFGVYYRNLDAMILSSSFSYKHYMIRLSYDVNTSKLTNISYGRGGFVISIVYITPYSKDSGGPML